VGSIEPSAERERIAALTAQVRRDLARIAHPRMPWLEARPAPGGTPALDVLIIGAGQSGLAIAFALMRAQVGNVLVIDKAAHGREGPWLTYARMRTLRPTGLFTNLGEVLSAPGLSDLSPYLSPAAIQRQRGITEDMLEQIPTKILSLLKVDEPRVVIYSFGQSLKPAPHSLSTSAA
jgi:hypothetical protein